MVVPALPRLRAPRYVESHWRGLDPIGWVHEAARELYPDPVVLPLTRFSGGVIFPVLREGQLRRVSSHDDASAVNLDITIVSVSSPRRAFADLLSLRGYGHTLVVLPPHYRERFFDLAELDLKGIGVVAAREDGAVQTLVRADGPPPGSAMAPWWRASREQQLVELSRG